MLKKSQRYDKALYIQNPSMSIHQEEGLIVEIAPMQRLGKTTVLHFSKYSSLCIAQKKPNVKLRLIGDLRKINKLVGDEFNNRIHPVNASSDAAENFAWRSFICTPNRSQAYKCLQMADQR